MKTGTKILLLLLLCSVIISGVSASGAQESAEAPGEAAAFRIVSLAPGITETVFALGKGENLVGRTDYCNFPLQAGNVQSVGPIQQPNIEMIISLKPDVVIASTHAPKEAADLLLNAGIEVKYFYAPQSFDGVYEVIRQVASEIDADAEGVQLIQGIRARYAGMISQSDGQRRPTVYYVVGFGEGGDWSAGGDTFIGAMIETAGGDNIASEISGWSFSLEKLVESDPDVIIIGEGQKDSFIKTPVYSELTAVKNSRVYGINEDIISRQGPRLIEGLEMLNRVFRSVE